MTDPSRKTERVEPTGVTCIGIIRVLSEGGYINGN